MFLSLQSVLAFGTLFLLALVPLSSVGESQAVSQGFWLRSGCVLLSYMLTFIAEYEACAHSTDSVFSVNGMSSFGDPGDSVILNCPVWVLGVYIAEVLPLCGT